MVAVTASPKVEPLDDSRWEEDSQMAPNLFNSSSPPVSPTTPLLSGEAKPVIDFSGLKLGHPFKGGLKKAHQKVHVSEDDSQGATQNDGAGQIANLTGRRCIKWLDNLGEDLIQVKEFEASDRDDEESDEDEPSSALCTCVIQ